MTHRNPEGSGNRIAFVTLGCPKNEVDSDRMMAAVSAAGFELVSEFSSADVVVLNTCGFIRDAVEEGIDAAMELAAWRDAQPGRRLVVAGCLVSRYGADLEESLTEADAFLPVSDEAAVVALLSKLLDVPAPAASSSVPGRMESVGPSAYLQISDGCFRTCAYCTIPSIRGPYRSRPLPEILEEARFLVGSGACEIVLIGQDTSAWGRDLPGHETLADVVTAVAAVEGLAWLRIMYVQPDGVTDDLLSAMVAAPNVCHYLDIPLQHASAVVLRGMQRSGSGAKYLGLLHRIRTFMPDVVLRTTLIAGFPGESRKDAEELELFLGDAEFDYVGVFPYSPEEGTEAGARTDQVPKRTRVARAQRLRDIADSVSTARIARLIGTEIEVLCEGVDEEGAPVGRWRGQAPEVDGIVLLDRPCEAGSLVRARVVDTLGYDLEVEVL